MVTKDGGEPRDLTHYERLVRDPKSHHIFFAMRVLEAHYSDEPRLGTARRPRQEKVRFGQEPELAFPKSTIYAFDPQSAPCVSVVVRRSIFPLFLRWAG